ncbi:MAG: hypothetical protein LBJ88_01695 [Campylobacteraceae bacterium]|jgi:hypothetical protein|nr:hypothetical protein [Campylobacteraceae bacterium]
MSAKLFILSLTAVLMLSACGKDKGSSNTTSGGGKPTPPIVTEDVSDKKYVCTGGGEVMYGYQLPPCPDSKENDKTLLGVDTNDNGVRDDVEVWIYHNYDTYKNCTKTIEVVTEPVTGKDINITYEIVHTTCTDEYIPYHQIVREIAMQYAKAYQIVIQEPKKARETEKFLSKAGECSFYFEKMAKYENEPILIDNYELYKELDEIQLNTIQRARAYSEYNFHLSGTSYRPSEDYRIACDFDVDKLLGK